MRNSLLIFVVISLLVHVAIWTGLRLTSTSDFNIKNQNVEIVILDQSPAQKRDLEKARQIVQQPDKALNDELDEKAKFLSAHNQRVVHETKAQQSGDFRNSAGRGEGQSQPTKQMAKQEPPQKQQKPAASESAVKKFAESSKSKNIGKVIDKNGTVPTLSDLSPKFDPSVRAPDNTVSAGNGSRASQTSDFLKDTPPSLQTMLSTREFVYYSYYQRIQNQIRQYWEPSIREKVRRIFASGRTIASERDHTTRVIIVLDREGNLIKVQVVGESGVKDLDDAAVEAFRAAAPFPNPPKGMTDKDGTIRVNWDFVIEANNFNFDQFRAPNPADTRPRQRFARR